MGDPALLRRVLRAKDRLDAASHEHWPVHRAAKVSGVSPAHFARSFKAAFGVPPHRHFLSRHIERAKTLLRDMDEPVTEIAFQTGWESLGTFGRIFRDITGENPSDLPARERDATVLTELFREAAAVNCIESQTAILRAIARRLYMRRLSTAPMRGFEDRRPGSASGVLR